MKYTNAVSFRQALDQHITRVHNEHGLSHTRIRKLIVFDRFLARLLAASPEGWVLKGGVALTLRWGHHARTTKDLDLGRLDDEEAATEHLIAAGTMDLDDFFTFTVERTAKLDALRDGVAVQYHVAVQLAGRPFDDITVEVGFGSVLSPEPDTVPGTELLGFAGIERLKIPTIALEQHLAEKVHAYTRSYESGGTSRVKDLVDLVLAEQFDTPHAGRLREALRSTFETRGLQALPPTLPRHRRTGSSPTAPLPTTSGFRQKAASRSSMMRMRAQRRSCNRFSMGQWPRMRCGIPALGNGALEWSRTDECGEMGQRVVQVGHGERGETDALTYVIGDRRPVIGERDPGL